MSLQCIMRFIKPYRNPVNKYTGIPKGFMKWALNWIYLFYEICTFLDKNHKTFWQRIKCPQEIPNWSPDWDLLGKIKSFICERFSFIYFVDLNHHEAFVVVLNIKFLEPVNFIPFFYSIRIIIPFTEFLEWIIYKLWCAISKLTGIMLTGLLKLNEQETRTLNMSCNLLTRTIIVIKSRAGWRWGSDEGLITFFTY